jgi:putative ATPase
MPRKKPESAAPSVFEELSGRAPLAARMRPTSLDEVAGQQHLLGPGRALRDSIEKGDTGSILLWGPPGSGKTTLARLVARYARAEFVAFSAVTEGVQRIREIVADAGKRLALGTRTILFIDEIHRWNRGQQDALLPHVEAGTVTLIGATTENPSFELNGALLSRLRVFVLEPLGPDALKELILRALKDEDRGLGSLKIEIDDDALSLLSEQSDGDARRALTILEHAALLTRPTSRAPRPDTPHASSPHATPHASSPHATPPASSPHGTPHASSPHATPHASRLTRESITESLQLRIPRYDKSGEEHYNLISALHKALRGSDPQGSLYWLARMIHGGEDPMYLARRMVRFATEDIGLADPRALEITIAARDAFHFLGSPEGELALAEACVYLATAPKSNRVYTAWGAARAAAAGTPIAPVPLHIRNAPTKLMKELGYGAGYEYAHAVPEAYTPQDYLPDEVADAVFYEPTAFGFEKEIAKRLEWWKALKERMTAGRPATPSE